MILLQYNGFGIVSIKRHKLTATITVVNGKHSVTRTVSEELDKPLRYVGEKETTALTFGAWIEQGKKSRVTAHEVAPLESGVLLYDIPQVRSIISKVVDMARKGVGIS